MDTVNETVKDTVDETRDTATRPEVYTVCDIQFRSGTKVYFFDPGALEIPTGADVILDTTHGVEFAQCVRGNHTVSAREVVAPLRPVLRLATERDQRINEENRAHEKHAFALCERKISEFGLEMQLVSTEYTFDGSKILFFFTADGRVDFRELVKALASALHTRIELRQIGVRDKAKMIGGLGICGRPFCCREFLDDFQPVSIKMAKTQNLSLNPTKISGTCGRLMCCLNYEQEAYEDLLRNSPKAESFVDTPDGRGTVTEVNLLRQSVRVRLEQQPETVVSHKNCDICVLRNGRAKKTDEPIPADLAPISGNRKPEPKESGFSTYLEPVVLRSEKQAEDTQSAQKQERSGKNKKHRPRGDKPHNPEKEGGAKKEGGQKAQPPKDQKPRKEPKPQKTDKSGGKNKAAETTPPTPQSPGTEGTQKPKSNHKRRYYKHHHSNKKPQT